MSTIKTLSLLFSLIAFNLFAESEPVKVNIYRLEKIFDLTINSSINPVIHQMIKNGIKKAQSNGNAAVLIRLNTPGGLVSTTKDIIQSFGQSGLPIIVWVTPQGASATSAGAIISSAATVFIMDEATHIGAATPINLNGDLKDGDSKGGDSDVRKKAVSDLVALISSFAQYRQRNTEGFSLMVSEAKSYTSKEAVENKVADALITSNEGLINFLKDRSINFNQGIFKIQVDKPTFEIVNLDLGQEVMNLFAQPQVAYLLFLASLALFYFEFQTAGGFIAGSIGLITLILSGIGFQVLPINAGAIGLIAASFIIFVLEIFITSYGLLSIIGVISLFFGSSMLFDSPDSLISLEKSLIYSVSSAIAVFILIIAWFFKKKKEKLKNFFIPLNEISTIENLMPQIGSKYYYQIKINGQWWKATSNEKLNIGDKVVIIGKTKNQLTYEIKSFKE